VELKPISRVLVIGGANMDIKAKTLSPHILATSNPAEIITKPGGVARNIAHNLAKLGVETTLLTTVGNDANAEIIISVTKKAGVNISHIMRVSAPTGIYLALLNEQGELVTAASDMANLSFLSQQQIKNKKGLVEAQDFVVADCNLAFDALDEIATHCAQKLIIEPVSVSKCLKLQELLKHHQIFLATPNLDQIEALTGTRDPQAAAKALHAKGLSNIVIHAGEQGAYASNENTFTHIPSAAIQIVDVTGAGDAATAGLIFGLTQNLPLENAAMLGQEMAARVIANNSSTLE
jgi:pseudouridine kinase